MNTKDPNRKESQESLPRLGERRRLARPTFLYKGMFVLQGSAVEIKALEPELKVEWYDREGNPHILSGISLKDLVAI